VPVLRLRRLVQCPPAFATARFATEHHASIWGEVAQRPYCSTVRAGLLRSLECLDSPRLCFCLAPSALRRVVALLLRGAAWLAPALATGSNQAPCLRGRGRTSQLQYSTAIRLTSPRVAATPGGGC
jgi:hypothetical protein